VGGSHVIDRMITAIIERDVEAYGALYSHDAVMMEPLFPGPVQGRQAITDGEAALFAAFSNIEIREVSRFMEENQLVVELTLMATNTGAIDLGANELVPPTGRRIEMPMAIFLETDSDGLIVNERDYFDTSSLMRQLGLG
jgi:ketosteroid isomerase-like protein